MFDVSQLLDEFDGHAYLNALVAIAQADGVKPEEEEFIRGQAEAMGIPMPDLTKPVDVATVIDVASTVTRRVIVRDCIVLAFVDGHYTEDERQRIFDIARQYGVETAMVERMERWAMDYSRVLAEGQAIISE